MALFQNIVPFRATVVLRSLVVSPTKNRKFNILQYKGNSWARLCVCVCLSIGTVPFNWTKCGYVCLNLHPKMWPKKTKQEGPLGFSVERRTIRHIILRLNLWLSRTIVIIRLKQEIYPGLNRVGMWRKSNKKTSSTRCAIRSSLFG